MNLMKKIKKMDNSQIEEAFSLLLKEIGDRDMDTLDRKLVLVFEVDASTEPYSSLGSACVSIAPAGDEEETDEVDMDTSGLYIAQSPCDIYYGHTE